MGSLDLENPLPCYPGVSQQAEEWKQDKNSSISEDGRPSVTGPAGHQFVSF